MNDELDTGAAVRDYLGQQTQQQAAAGVAAAAGTSGDLEAELRRASARTGVPMSTARAMPQAVQRRAEVGQVLETVQQFPSTMQFLAAEDNARIAHDDTGALTAIETAIGKTARYIVGAPGTKQGMVTDLLSGVPAASRGAAGLFAAPLEVAAPAFDWLEGVTSIGGNPVRRLAEGFRMRGAEADAMARRLSPPAEGLVQGGVSAGMQSLTQNLMVLPAGLATQSVTSVSALMGAITGGRSYLTAREKGVGVGTSLGYGASDAVIEYATERIPVGRLFSDLKAGAPLFKTVLRQAGAEIPGEQVATVLQDLNEWAVLNPEKPFSAYLRERPSAAAQTLIATLVGVGGNVAVMKGLQGALDRVDGVDRRTQALADLMQASADSKTRSRDPVAFADFVQAAAGASAAPTEVFVDAKAFSDALQQSGVTPDQAAAAMPSVAAQLAEAMATGGDLVIPVGELAAGVAGSPLEQALMQHVRTEAEGVSAAEAQTLQADETMQAVADKAVASQPDTTSRDVVRQTVLDDLNATGRFTPDVNAAYADLTAQFFASQAQRLGMTPEALYSKYALKTQAAGTFGDALQQLSPGPQRFTAGDTTISYTVAREGYAEVSMVRTPADKRGQGSARAAMQQFLAEADAAGVTVFLTAEPMDASTGKAKLQSFYKSLGFKPNKGRNKDFRAIAGMVREPQGLKQGDQQARGTFSPSANTITLLAKADLSTFLHESGHFYLEVLADLAAQENAPVEIQQDMDKVLKWFGITTDEAGPTALETWRSWTLEDQRPYHEKFARGFEAYLFEGKAPSSTLAQLFDRFKAWILAVYKSIKALNVEINDDVRGVFDRLLASQEEIEQAEAMRNMAPLFKDAKDAGMTEAEWQVYQGLGRQATGDAIDQLQARSLRDMRWLSHARDKRLREMQRAASAQRRAIRAEVRPEVMRQPVYRAWAFLTGRAAPQDQAQPTPKEKRSKTADPGRDSLLEAVAKMGGINRESARRDLDVSDDDAKFDAGVFGSPVFRKTGGMDADSARAALTELGYLSRFDEFGRTEIAELRDLVGQELGGDPVRSMQYDYGREFGRPDPLPETALSGKLSTSALRAMYGTGPDAIWRRLSAQRMTSDELGVDPDVVAETFGFGSGDELVRALLTAEPPAQVIDALTDQRMLERYGDMADQQGIERAVDAALHNDARAKFVATELAALDKAVGKPRVLMAAARRFAADLLGRRQVKDVKVGPFNAAEARAAKEAASAKGVAERATAKRNQLFHHYASRSAREALEMVDKGVDYLRKFDKDSTRASLPPEYLDQIDALLERFDLRKSTSGRDIARRQSLAAWLEAQTDMGIEPDIPAELLATVGMRSYKELTVDEFRGLVDTVRQIDHLGRLKNKLLTAKDAREFQAVVDEMVASIDANADGRAADTRTPNTLSGQALVKVKGFGAAHIKAATWARILDGGRDGGPVWEHLVRTANEAGDRETVARAKATQELAALVTPLLADGKMGGKGTFFPSINRNLNREARLAIALNWGNDGNRQRLLGGEGWAAVQVVPVLQSLTTKEWQFVQQVWDYFETYLPQIAAKERRVYGREPQWIDPAPVNMTLADGSTISLRGGYYPVKYDPRASERAESHSQAEEAKTLMRAAYTSATTRASFRKPRAEEVNGRPLLYSLDGIYNGVQEVIHDLSWHEWLIDANRLVKNPAIASTIRTTYGPDAHQQLKTWLQDVAQGSKPAKDAGEMAAAWIRQSVSLAGLGLNVMNAMLQPLGITQSMVRIGPQWVGRGIAKAIGAPISTAREISELSPFMRTRFLTQFRELDEVRNQVKGQGPVRTAIDATAYAPMLFMQRMVDVPTWWGAYEKALADGNDEARAVALADQAVIDSQGSGQVKDLSAIERGSPAMKLFTQFYSFFNTTLNLSTTATMTEDNKAKLVAQYLLLFTVPALLGALLKDALTPGDAGDDDPEQLARKLAGAQLSYLLAQMVLVRELGPVANMVAGENFGTDYGGPSGLRMLSDFVRLSKEVGQGQADTGLRKAVVNLAGDLLRLPSAQINRSITGTQALLDGKTENPAAVLFGYQEPR